MRGYTSHMSADLFRDMPFDNILKCVHCGLCLDACPTYRETGAEQESPRGRLYLMRGLWEGELEPEPGVIAPLQRCLDCRACESACPSGVPYGELLEKARAVVKPHQKGSRITRFMVDFFLKRILPSDGALLWSSRIGRMWQASGLDRLATKLLPRSMARMQLLMPGFSGQSYKKKVLKEEAAIIPTVALFSGCIMDVAEAEIHQASVNLLKLAGYQVAVPPNQTCCGALQVHGGDRQTASKLATKNLEVLGKEHFDAIIVNSAGCGAQLKEYHHLLDEESDTCHAFSQKVHDLLEFLATRPQFVSANSWKEEPVTVLYDAPCHLIHAQKIDNKPRSLLASLPGVNLVTPNESSRCCGAAGIYNLLHETMAEQVLGRKMDDLEATLANHPSATILLTANPGCLFQLRYGVSRRKLPLQVMHPAVFLEQRCR